MIGVIAGAVPSQCLTALRALNDFRYYAQAPQFGEDDIARLEYSLKEFHDNKAFLTHSGARVGRRHVIEHWEIPKLELLQSVMTSIRLQGAPTQWTAEVTECAHVHLMKKPARSGNNHDSHAQMCRHLDRVEKCFLFDQATSIRKAEYDNNNNNNTSINSSQNHHVTRKIPDYFARAQELLSGSYPTAPHPYRMFAVERIAFHVCRDPSLTNLTVDAAASVFSLADLPHAICHYLRSKSTCTELTS